MDINKPTLIASIAVVFVVGLVFGGFTNIDDAITGQGIRRDRLTTISVEPTRVQADGRITVTVTPGSEGAERPVYFYSIGDMGQLRVRMDVTYGFCPHNNVCKDQQTFEYKIPSTWSDRTYAATVVDARTEEKIVALFEVGYEEPKGHA
ncbi:hypothetical protein CL621_02970 [archaeon]|nr:hypothetical protein [archaeon]